MQIETTSSADRTCRDLLREAYPGFCGFSGITELWDKMQEVLARKSSLDLCTTGGEDCGAQDILEEVFEEACRTAREDYDFPTSAYEYVDYKKLWERLCGVLGVSV